MVHSTAANYQYSKKAPLYKDEDTDATIICSIHIGGKFVGTEEKGDKKRGRNAKKKLHSPTHWGEGGSMTIILDLSPSTRVSF